MGRRARQGALLRPQTQAARLQTAEVIPGGVAYGFAIFEAKRWIGHNGDIPGYTTVVVYLPECDATLVVMTNSDEPQDHLRANNALRPAVTLSPGAIETYAALMSFLN